jgi:hypothetical protein
MSRGQKLAFDFCRNVPLCVPPRSSGGNRTDYRLDDRVFSRGSQSSASLGIRDMKPFGFLPFRQRSIIADYMSGDQGITSGS